MRIVHPNSVLPRRHRRVIGFHSFGTLGLTFKFFTLGLCLYQIGCLEFQLYRTGDAEGRAYEEDEDVHVHVMAAEEDIGEESGNVDRRMVTQTPVRSDNPFTPQRHSAIAQSLWMLSASRRMFLASSAAPQAGSDVFTDESLLYENPPFDLRSNSDWFGLDGKEQGTNLPGKQGIIGNDHNGGHFYIYSATKAEEAGPGSPVSSDGQPINYFSYFARQMKDSRLMDLSPEPEELPSFPVFSDRPITATKPQTLVDELRAKHTKTRRLEKRLQELEEDFYLVTLENLRRMMFRHEMRAMRKRHETELAIRSRDEGFFSSRSASEFVGGFVRDEGEGRTG
ncbi:hypothetical protein M422DRAFT_258833 [Sphaerobolus stellatus SS14]|uniref:Unplaced genomic scaffold SPHSTscaffold_85, whole genome shotgun sequence n=1 Tax=Sphaerobolus stellatus (strain SS14) TaxID=990650 RepID=A0A0C9T617_SPHS4|nr:hypothetical protein M422DRAFT_274869 [Sphaerobolus stellatus SS14]KIJ38465.1 hypothetical protein M422DRAFT_258833 [Sphaerobolus stellatus SS14]